MEQGQDLWPFIASIIYTAAWCFSSYAQIYQLFKLKSAEGFSLNYLALNITGYACYTIYSSVGYFTNIKGAGTVVIADLVFVYHIMLMVIIEAIQCMIYRKGQNRLTKKAISLVIFFWIVIWIEILLYYIGTVAWYQYWNPITLLGYVKLTITLIKYTPAAYWNYKRKCTEGWSTSSIILDLIGGIFSFASGGISVENGLNIAKVALAIITVVFDLFFCFQFVIYRKNNNRKKQQLQESLLKSEDNSSKIERQ